MNENSLRFWQPQVRIAFMPWLIDDGRGELVELSGVMNVIIRVHASDSFDDISFKLNRIVCAGSINITDEKAVIDLSREVIFVTHTRILSIKLSEIPPNAQYAPD